MQYMLLLKFLWCLLNEYERIEQGDDEEFCFDDGGGLKVVYVVLESEKKREERRLEKRGKRYYFIYILYPCDMYDDGVNILVLVVDVKREGEIELLRWVEVKCLKNEIGDGDMVRFLRRFSPTIMSSCEPLTLHSTKFIIRCLSCDGEISFLWGLLEILVREKKSGIRMNKNLLEWWLSRNKNVKEKLRDILEIFFQLILYSSTKLID